ncbi:MAG: hypothetical protein L6408_05735 [Nanoarchaeota archaeon]|nr:hypothetical protein [Nanoarchaeota archaeon]
MKLPKTFRPENQDHKKTLERLLAKHIYILNKKSDEIQTYDLKGNLLARKEVLMWLPPSKCFGDGDIPYKERKTRATDFKKFKFGGITYFTVRCGPELQHRAVFNSKLKQIYTTENETANQAWGVYERKTNNDVIMIQTSNSNVSFFDIRFKEVGDYYFSAVGTNALLRGTTRLKTKKENYMALNFFDSILIIDEKFEQRGKFDVYGSSFPMGVYKNNGKEEIAILSMSGDRWNRYQTLELFDNGMHPINEPIPTDTIFNYKKMPDITCMGTLNIEDNSYLYFLMKIGRSKSVLKLLDTELNEVWETKHFDSEHQLRVEKYNSQEYIFLPCERKGKKYTDILDKNLNKKDSIKTYYSFKDYDTNYFIKYKIMNMNGEDHIVCANSIEDRYKLFFYKGDFPFNKKLFRKQEPIVMDIKKEKDFSNINILVPFEQGDEAYFAVNNWSDDWVKIYDSKFKHAIDIDGSDFCAR